MFNNNRFIIDRHRFNVPNNFFFFSDSPACAQGQQQIYEAAKLQTVKISCYVNANPHDSIDFSWSFNNSANLMDIPVCLRKSVLYHDLFYRKVMYKFLDFQAK